MLRMLASLVILVGEFVLLFFAWKTWIMTVRAELPQWRNALCLLALLLLSMNWCGATLLAVLLFVRQDASAVAGLTQVMLTLSRPLDIVAVAFAVALKRGSRVKAVVAGVLMFAGWPLGYV
jgi:hypothetical protein